MISFMLQQVTLVSVLIAAAVAFAISFVFCSLFPKHCGDSRCCDNRNSQGCGCCCDSSMNRQAGVNNNFGSQNNFSAQNNYHNNQCGYGCCSWHHGACGMACGVFHMVGKFFVFLAQAYGLAFLLERLMVLSNYKDALSAAVFIALTLVVSYVFCAVLKHHKTLKLFIKKAIHILLEFAAMAAVFVYMAM